MMYNHEYLRGMADCELCGAMRVSTRAVIMGKAQIQACKRCVDKMGLVEHKVAPGLSNINTSRNSTSGGYGGIGKKGKDIMLKREKELHSNFDKIVTRAREERGWDKRELARRMAEKINIINSVESGKRPTDDVIRKLERTLGLKLMVDSKPDENRHVQSGKRRGFTLGDFLLDGKE